MAVRSEDGRPQAGAEAVLVGVDDAGHGVVAVAVLIDSVVRYVGLAGREVWIVVVAIGVERRFAGPGAVAVRIQERRRASVPVVVRVHETGDLVGAAAVLVDGVVGNLRGPGVLRGARVVAVGPGHDRQGDGLVAVIVAVAVLHAVQRTVDRGRPGEGGGGGRRVVVAVGAGRDPGGGRRQVAEVVPVLVGHAGGRLGLLRRGAREGLAVGRVAVSPSQDVRIVVLRVGPSGAGDVPIVVRVLLRRGDRPGAGVVVPVAQLGRSREAPGVGVVTVGSLHDRRADRGVAVAVSVGVLQTGGRVVLGSGAREGLGALVVAVAPRRDAGPGQDVAVGRAAVPPSEDRRLVALRVAPAAAAHVVVAVRVPLVRGHAAVAVVVVPVAHLGRPGEGGEVVVVAVRLLGGAAADVEPVAVGVRRVVSHPVAVLVDTVAGDLGGARMDAGVLRRAIGGVGVAIPVVVLVPDVAPLGPAIAVRVFERHGIDAAVGERRDEDVVRLVAVEISGRERVADLVPLVEAPVAAEDHHVDSVHTGAVGIGRAQVHVDGGGDGRRIEDDVQGALIDLVHLEAAAVLPARRDEEVVLSGPVHVAEGDGETELIAGAARQDDELGGIGLDVRSGGEQGGVPHIDLSGVQALAGLGVGELVLSARAARDRGYVVGEDSPDGETPLGADRHAEAEVVAGDLAEDGAERRVRPVVQ